MSLAYPDKVQVTNITRDATNGKQTDGTPFTSKANVEDESEIRYASDGTPITPVMLIIFPPDVTIAMGDKVEIKKLHGSTPTTDEAKERFVRQAARVGGGSASHVEVML